jgi:Flp pilus assembly pilin Flp
MKRSSLAKRCGRHGQSVIETTLLLAVVAIALVTFFSFIRSAVSSRIKLGADTFGHGLLHNGN